MNVNMLKAAVVGLGISVSFAGNAGVIYGNNYGDLFEIDTTTGTVTDMGMSVRHGPEIEMNKDGSGLIATTHDKSYNYDLSTQADLGTVDYTGLQGEHDTITAAEWANGKLYTAFALSGPEKEGSGLYTYDYLTGGATFIGDLTNTNRPLGGLAFLDGVMYGVTATDNKDSALWTIDLNTGISTLVGQILHDGVQLESVTGLVVSGDTMYFNTHNDTYLYTIDTSNGVAQIAFDAGVTFSALAGPRAAVPEPSTLAIFALGFLALVSRKFKK